MPRILLVEDEEHLAEGIRFNLELDGCEVETIGDGLRALERLLPPPDGGPPPPPFDLVLLDVMLPGLDGFQVVDRMRQAGNFTPVLILRHTASVMTLDDAMWARLELGAAHELKDPTTGEPATRNPFVNHRRGDRHTMIGAEAGLDVLVAGGAIVLTCNNALRGVAYRLRQKETQLTADAAMAEVRRSVLPGVSRACAMPDWLKPYAPCWMRPSAWVALHCATMSAWMATTAISSRN